MAPDWMGARKGAAGKKKTPPGDCDNGLIEAALNPIYKENYITSVCSYWKLFFSNSQLKKLVACIDKP